MSSFHSSQVEPNQRKFIKIESKNYRNQRFQFQSYELAFAVRETVYMKIIAFDANNDQQFQEDQIRDFLQNVLHQSQSEVKYVIRNVFRYDFNNDGVIQYDQLVNFCMQQHFGQLAIQRLHKKKMYKKGSQRLMNEKEFNETIKYALSFIEFNPSENDLKTVFQTIDNDKDGEISYEDYFRFLKEYFGTKSYAAGLVNKRSILEQIHNSREKKGGETLNIVKRYSKYQNLMNNPNKIPQTNIPKTLPSNNQKIQPTEYNSAQNSVASSTNKKNSKIELTIVNKNKQNKNQIVFSNNQQVLAIKIARLVYTQLIVLLTQYDLDKDCMLSPEDIIAYLKSKLSYTDLLSSQIYKKHNLARNKLLTYQEAAKIVISEQIFNTFRTYQQDSCKMLQLPQFCQLFQKVCSIVSNPPVLQKYQNLYLSRSQKGVITLSEAENLSNLVFNSYKK